MPNTSKPQAIKHGIFNQNGIICLSICAAETPVEKSCTKRTNLLSIAGFLGTVSIMPWKTREAENLDEKSSFSNLINKRFVRFV